MTFSSLAINIAFTIVSTALFAVLWRIVRGPSSADRVIATDMLGLLGISFAALLAALTGLQGFLDVAFGVAIFGFLTAVGFGALLERVSLNKDASE